MVASIPQIYRYRLDRSDVIDFVDSWWLAFATENGADELNETFVVGRPIWDFIGDEPTRSLYREVYQHVRSTGQPIDIPFRCDSPTLRRYMQLTVRREKDDRLLLESKMIRTASQQGLRVLSRSARRSSSFLTMCSFCKRSLIEPAGWLEMQDIALRLKLDDQ